MRGSLTHDDAGAAGPVADGTGEANVPLHATTRPRGNRPRRARSTGRPVARPRSSLYGALVRLGDNHRAARPPQAISADRAVHEPLQDTTVLRSHHQQIVRIRGEAGQHSTWVTFWRLDADSYIGRDAAGGGAERTPDQFRRRRALRIPGEHQHHPTATTAATPAAMARQAKRPGPDGHQRSSGCPGQADGLSESSHAARRVIDADDNASPSGTARSVRLSENRRTYHHLRRSL